MFGFTWGIRISEISRGREIINRLGDHQADLRRSVSSLELNLNFP